MYKGTLKNNTKIVILSETKDLAKAGKVIAGCLTFLYNPISERSFVSLRMTKREPL